ncbi:MAG TPA: right-handed parallel beta-helix repeat-containing protein [Candidatus Eisenbacteria bacterium]|nr:right-handed parallel beta-helix repeat-containing protein [Candidatus Eisenbacteria bacterium]
MVLHPHWSQCIWLLSTVAVVLWATLARAATFTVSNTNASGGGSLAQAIMDANGASDLDTIEFAIPGGGVPTIVASLPAITQPVTIDGTTQSGGFVELRNGGGTALTINGNGSIVRGMVLNSSTTGVALGAAAGGNTITGCRIGTDPTGTMALANQIGVFIQNPSGGNNTISNNLISGNTQTGVSILGNDNVVIGNVIGLDVTQADGIGGGTGVLVNVGTGNRIGGTQPGEGNVIAGLTGSGLSLANTTVANTVVQGNRIGTNAAGDTGLGMSGGVNIASVTGTGNVIGGPDPGAGNLIVASSSTGMQVLNSSNITIQGNTIGTAALPNASHGVDMVGADGNLLEDNLIGGNAQAGVNFRSGADGNTLRGNEITGNGAAGIAISGGQRDHFTENAIHDNGGLAIDLGVTGVNPNDPQDADVAPGHNDAQNYPVLSTVSASQVTGSLNSTPDTSFTVELFANLSCDASGNGEGRTFLGAIQLMTDASGDGGVMFALPPEVAGQFITATATDPNGNTSEFSACTGAVPTTTTTTSPTTTSTQPTTSTTTTTSTTSTTTTVPSTTTTTTSSTTTTSTTSTTATTTTVASTTTTTTSSTTTTSTTSTTNTSSSVTSSSAPPTTTTSRSTTTTTTLGGTCATEPVAPTFRSLNCRLAALLDQVVAASDLGSFQGRLRRLLEKAKEHEEQAEESCRTPDTRRSRKLLKQAFRDTMKVTQALRSLRARKSLAPTLRGQLLEAANGIQADLRRLKLGVHCPQDAG